MRDPEDDDTDEDLLDAADVADLELEDMDEDRAREPVLEGDDLPY
jgi:hypothetical protein